VLVLLVVLLAGQPSVHQALAEEPALFTVVGVEAATLRAEAAGSSMALALVPVGSVVAQAGPDAIEAGVVWRYVRTAEGGVGYLPAGFLAYAGGGPALSAPAAPAAGAAPAQSVGAAPAPPAGAAAPSQAGGAPAGVETGRSPPPSALAQPPPPPTPPTPSEPAVRTTVEHRRGQDVRIARIDEATAPDGRKMGAGRIVVKFKQGATEQGKAAAHQAAGTKATEGTGRAGMTVAKVDPGSVPRALAAYRSRSDVAWAEPDYVYRATLTTNDPQLPSQWGPRKIGAPIAWDVTTGSPSVFIAILDSGVYSDTSSYIAPDGGRGHPDLRGKVVLERDFTMATTGWDDWYGHGTLMAGIAGARTNTSPAQGIAGIGFNARLFNGKVLDDTGSGFDSWVAQGVVWAADNGAHVISMSLGGPGGCSQTMQDAVTYAWGRGVVIVAAAGNGAISASESPGNCAQVIPVGAIDQGDGRASFSNYGPSVPLAAPGVSILSTDYVGTYTTVSGTSPATPHVAGVAALLRSTPYGSTNQSIVNRLFQTADPIVGTGSIWGYGRVNAAAAVGPASCSPRPKVTVTSAPSGGLLQVTTTTAGVGNAVRYIRTGAAAGQTINALASFPTQTSQDGATTTYVPQNVGASATFQVERQVPGFATTLPFVVTDGCGTWNSLAGGGAGAGF